LPEFGARATSILVSVSHWRSAGGYPSGDTRGDRSRTFLTCVGSALNLEADRIVVVVITNDVGHTSRELERGVALFPEGTTVSTLPDAFSFDPRFVGDRDVIAIRWQPRFPYRHPYYLTWGHKWIVGPVALARTFSHYVYLEDDIRFTNESLAYWRRNRLLLAPSGLLPGFVRYESFCGGDYVVDQRRSLGHNLAEASIQAPGRSGAPDERQRFVQLPNPYQGMYVLDRGMAERHYRRSLARDPFRSRSISGWGVRERAAIGPTLDQVPHGFAARNVVPLAQDSLGRPTLERSCLVEHLTGNYASGRSTPLGKVLIADLFEA
jgi:hypothetical protein